MEFPDGNEEFAIWEPLMYADMCDNGMDFQKLFYSSPDIIKTPPLEVSLWLYDNPVVKHMRQTINSNELITQVLVGRRICFIRSF